MPTFSFISVTKIPDMTDAVSYDKINIIISIPPIDVNMIYYKRYSYIIHFNIQYQCSSHRDIIYANIDYKNIQPLNYVYKMKPNYKS